MTKIISVIGDSHTWGQGVGGDYHFNPGCCIGDLRMLPFGYPGYVNLLRHAVNLLTGSEAVEYFGKKLHALCEEAPDDFGYFSANPLVIEEKFSCLRILLRAADCETAVQVYIDDVLTDTVVLAPAVQECNACVKIHTCHAEDGKHTLRLVPVNGAKIGIYRIECYSGPYAVVNCAVGACAVGRYVEQYYDTYVTPLNPWMIVFEGCTINDWLTRETPAEYADVLRVILNRMRQTTENILWHTVSPIGGEQKTTPDAEPYDAYIDAMRRVAEEEKIPLVDSNQVMKDTMQPVRKDWWPQMMFHDDWHPNGTGHYLYAESIFEELRKML